MTRDVACLNCGELREADRWGIRCRPCSDYWRRHGSEHPLPVRRCWVPGTPCVVCGQTTQHEARGRCPRDYSYWYRHGVDRPARVDQLGTARPCRHRECATVTRKLTRGFCSKHYLRLWRRGLPPLARTA